MAKVGEIRKLLAFVDDDFEFEINVTKKVSEEELKQRNYAYPYDHEICSVDNKSYDIGHSDKVFRLGVEIEDL